LRKVKVNLTKYVATEAGLRYCPAVITSNGRIKQDIVVLNDKEERHPEGAVVSRLAQEWRTGSAVGRQERSGCAHPTRPEDV
jgi:hypothetical protein